MAFQSFFLCLRNTAWVVHVLTVNVRQIFIGVLLVSLGFPSSCRGKLLPVNNCPRFVEEGLDLSCTCDRPGLDIWPSSIMWTYSNSTSLFVPSVSSQDNNTKFMCEMLWKGKRYATIYILQVAYGPSNKSMHIKRDDGPGPFITSGSRNLTLICWSDHVNPEPVYVWLTEPCKDDKEKDTCTFQPDPAKDDGKTMICRAMNSVGHSVRVGVATYTLHLNYPPTDAPLVTGHAKGQIHRSGDELKCIVSGGKPLVSEVIFSCRNPVHKDQRDVRTRDSVSSPLTLNSSRTMDMETNCKCTAVWKPESGLYIKETSVSFALLPAAGTSDDSEEENIQTIVVKEGAAGWIVLGIVVVVFAVMKVIDCRKIRHLTKTVASQKQTISVVGSDTTDPLLQEPCGGNGALFVNINEQPGSQTMDTQLNAACGEAQPVRYGGSSVGETVAGSYMMNPVEVNSTSKTAEGEQPLSSYLKLFDECQPADGNEEDYNSAYGDLTTQGEQVTEVETHIPVMEKETIKSEPAEKTKPGNSKQGKAVDETGDRGDYRNRKAKLKIEERGQARDGKRVGSWQQKASGPSDSI